MSTHIDGPDVLIFAGLLLLVCGLALVSIPLALVVLGGLLLIAGVFLSGWRSFGRSDS